MNLFSVNGITIDKKSATGSRGLLYHALLAEQLSDVLIADDETVIPKEFAL